MKKFISAVFPIALTAHSETLEGIIGYIPETSKIINQTSIQATTTVRKVQKTEDLSIPKDWRLISVSPISKIGSNEQEFMLFFQDSKANVHTLGITASGMITGRNNLKIKSTD